MTKIDLLIPTYNRSKPLIENLTFIVSEIEQLEKDCQVKIIVSDNASTDNTEVEMRDFIKTHQHIEILYNINKTNIGLEKNIVKTLSLSTSENILWCGDDDIFQKKYLQFCFNTIQTKPNIGLQITGITKIDEKGKESKIRNEDFEQKEFQSGIDVILKYSYLGHQLSGLLMNRETLLEDYLRNTKNRNMYMFIYFVTNRMLRHDVLYVPKFSTKVSVANVKYWAYNNLGLLDEVFKAYKPFKKEIGEKNIMKLMLKFIKLQADFRLDIKKNKPFKLVKQYFQLIHLVNYNLYFSFHLFFLLLRVYISILKR